MALIQRSSLAGLASFTEDTAQAAERHATFAVMVVGLAACSLHADHLQFAQPQISNHLQIAVCVSGGAELVMVTKSWS